MIWVNAIIFMTWAGIYDECHMKIPQHSSYKAAPGCQKSRASYKFNSVNFDSKKLSVETLWDHLK